ncbi:origin recognition complex, subunit 6 [Suhomyces tanzawaensis NRRL Y-17324]|uniref:Origin recognition complex, subunit 6 n=1 Tax=Suhomyces tanzawaensis NRRL Y-17324 TaxID=984487 RepID=A0A1E4SIW1_9ASCO|nr:origin recognition complex, subunit 6 [Suhomyces tanzawaensis NRRL Y-17324]ODV79445.1 origin recognition complex, subunit 6 [Suhomyces tanzawaensis NRRL Y-17324]
MNSQLKQSFQDVIPTFQGQLPPEVLTCGDSLYQLSLQKQPVLPKRCEIARYHICAYLAAEKYLEQLGLPKPETNKIPLQPKLVSKLLDDFRENLLYQIRSTTSTPKSSPKKAGGSVYSTPMGTPSRTRNSPAKVSSPLKRLQELKDEHPAKRTKTDNSDFRDVDSPFNPKVKDSLDPPSPSKVSKSPKKSPKKSSPSKGTPKTTVYKYDKKHVSIEDFISFANNFYIPPTVTPKMIETFLVHKHKFTKKSEWLLACGMVNAAYTRINHRLLTSKMGAKSQLINHLFQYQKGGLMKWNMQIWCDIVDDWVKDEGWVLEIERTYMYESQSMEEVEKRNEMLGRNGRGWELLDKFGSMIHGDVLYDGDIQETYFENWKTRVMKELAKN